MRINLAKLVPWVGVLVVFFFWLAAQNTEPDSSGDDSYDYSYADTTRADRYLDRAAIRLAQPGVYVDNGVLEGGGLTEQEAEQLDALAADTAGPVRVLVVPADELREHAPDDPAATYTNDIAYPDDDLPGQLYDRVGVDGTYAVLVDAGSSYEGRSFTAYQFAEERPFYDVEGALDEAVDCCAPDYGSMLQRFLERAGDEKTNPWPIVGWVVGGLAALIGLWVGGRRVLDRRREKAQDAEVADALRPSLQEEVVELSRTVAALPPPPPDQPEIADRTRQVLDLVEEARHRLDEADGSARMDTPGEVEEVVLRLGDARYELVALDALRRGVPVPEKTAPCFFDPRHGPSVAEVAFTPSGGSERQVPVCAACRDEMAAGRVPPTRTLTLGGLVRPYWQGDRFSRPYVNGYWRRHTFPDQDFQRQRYGSARPVARVSRPPAVQFVWESGDNGGSGSGSWWSSGGGGGGRRFSGSSGSRRSFGGGSSSRSSRRSGGSRRF